LHVVEKDFYCEQTSVGGQALEIYSPQGWGH